MSFTGIDIIKFRYELDTYLVIYGDGKTPPNMRGLLLMDSNKRDADVKTMEERVKAGDTNGELVLSENPNEYEKALKPVLEEIAGDFQTGERFPFDVSKAQRIREEGTPSPVAPQGFKEVVLRTENGDPVAKITLPFFQSPPEAIGWGSRVFFRKDLKTAREYEYREGFFYVVPK